MPYTKEQLTIPILQQVLNDFGFDGHSLYDPDVMIKQGHPDWLINEHRREYTSVVGDPKRTVFSNKDGTVVSKCTAVHGLDLLEGVVHALGLPGSKAMGRGFAARQLSEQIEDYISDHNEQQGDKTVDSGGPDEVKQ